MSATELVHPAPLAEELAMMPSRPAEELAMMPSRPKLVPFSEARVSGIGRRRGGGGSGGESAGGSYCD